MPKRQSLRHARQIRLPEVGPGGQARVGAATVAVRLDGLAADVAVRYLAGAGFGCIRVRDERLAELARAIDPAVRVEVVPTLAVDGESAEYDLRDATARDVARGARAALVALRSALVEAEP